MNKQKLILIGGAGYCEVCICIMENKLIND